MEIKKAVFVKSATKMMEAPNLKLPEFAMIGRSNVWKSTLINMLTNYPLARASKVPWKTQLMNFFLIDDAWMLVDLPGYGYAKVWVISRRDWMNSLEVYFKRRAYLRLVFVLVDLNIPVQELDLEFMQTLYNENIPFDIIVTKIDKPNQKDFHKNLKSLQEELKLRLPRIPNIFMTSSVKKTGRKEILDYIEEVINSDLPE